MSDNIEDTVARLYVGQLPGLDQSAEAVLDAASDLMKDRWLAIFIQLTSSSKFKDFINNHFLIQDIINEEEKSIQTLVIERPYEVKYQLTGAQLLSLRNVLAENKVKKIPKVMDELLTVLHHEDKSIILSDDINEAKKSIILKE